MIKLTEYWLNIIIGLLIIVFLFLLIGKGWDSISSIKFILFILSVVILTIFIIVIPRKSNQKEIIITEKYPFSNSMLLMCIKLGKSQNGVNLVEILQNCDFIDRSYLSFDELRISTQNMLSIGMIRFVDRKYLLTDKFKYYFDESFINDSNIWKQLHSVHALLNCLSLNVKPIEEIDFYSQEEYQSAINEYIKQSIKKT